MDAGIECGREVTVRIFLPRKTDETFQPECPGVPGGGTRSAGLMYSGYEPGSHVHSPCGYRPETTRASTSAATAPRVVWAALKPRRKSASEKLA